MTDVAIEFAIVTAVAWLATWRVLPQHAHRAHRLWLLVSAAPSLWLLLSLLLSSLGVPAIHIIVRSEWGFDAPIATASSAALTIIYVAGTALFMARAGHAILASRRVWLESEPLPDRELVQLRTLVADHDVTIHEGEVAAPLTVGVVRARVILPRRWRELPEECLQAVLAHELAHVRRRDLAVALWCLCLETVMWWHPAVWVTTSRLRWFAELACDRHAAERMPPGRYAATLLGLASRWQLQRPALAISVITSAIGRRISILLDESERPPQRRARIVLAAAIILATLPTATVVSFHWQSAAVELFDRELGSWDHTASHADAHRRRHLAGHSPLVP